MFMIVVIKSVLLSTTNNCITAVVVRGEGIAPEIALTKSVRFFC